MQVVLREDEPYEPRLSNGLMSCLVPPMTFVNSPKRTVSYNQLHPHPLMLTVLKLDGSSFGIEVDHTGTIGDLKRAVELAFCHLPKKGPGRVSWKHVWGQFCLCHQGQKLLKDDDYIGMIGIKDGDQLQFIHHASYNHRLSRVKSVNDDSDSDDETDNVRHKKRDKDGQRIDLKHEEQDENLELVDGVISHCNFTRLLRGWFRYRKLRGAECGILASLRNLVRLSSSNKYESHRETRKGK